MSIFGRKKPKSLADIPRRWDAMPPRKLPDHDALGRPSKALSMGIAVLCLMMIAAVVMLYNSGAFRPVEASAESGPRATGNEALTASLDSARKLMGQSEWLKAEAVLRQASMQFPDQQEVRIALAETLLALGKAPESYTQYEKALAIGPRDAKLEFAAGQVANTANLPERAEEHFSMVQSIDPHNAAVPMMLGMVQRKLGKLEPAKASLLRAVNMDPDNAYAWGTLADIALSENNINLCLQHITRARKVQPESTEWRLIAARAHARKAEPEESLRLIISLDLSERRRPPVARLAAQCYGMLNRNAEAASALADAFKGNPTDGDLAYDAAAAFEKAGTRNRALEFATQAQILGNKAAGPLLQKLNHQ